MRSFFKRPSWASRGTEDSNPNFYRRSEQTYGDIIAATKEERERAVINTAGDYPEENSRANKHRRVSNQECFKDKNSPDVVDEEENQGSGAVGDLTSSAAAGPESSPSYVPWRTREQSISCQASSKSEICEESTDTDNGRLVCSRGSSSPIQSAYEESNTYGQSTSQSHKECENETKGESTKHDTNAQEDAVVQILITSEIENTKPLIVHRKVSQSLKEVRIAWCKRQDFTEGMQSSVFLIWKGRRLFDVTTCKSLGINFVDKPAESFTHCSFDDEKTIRIHMEAVTEDVLASRRRQRQSHVSMSGDQTGSGAPDEKNKKEDSLVKVILKCPGLVDFKIKVSQETEVSRILETYIKAQHIPTEKEVYLIFDGERLDPDSRLSDNDIADLDLVDVLVK